MAPQVPTLDYDYPVLGTKLTGMSCQEGADQDLSPVHAHGSLLAVTESTYRPTRCGNVALNSGFTANVRQRPT
jgi:hypothetical protein